MLPMMLLLLPLLLLLLLPLLLLLLQLLLLPHEVPGKPENGRGLGALRHEKESKRIEVWLLQ